MEEIQKLFDNNNLYEILGLEKDADNETIKRAYRKSALKYHPDKNGGDPLSQSRFQSLSLIYSILSDEEKRRVYDRTGNIEDAEGITKDGKEWYTYWRNLFPEITVENIQGFEKEYKHSEEEQKDVLEAYVKYQGNLDSLLSVVMLSEEEDLPRFIRIIKEAILNDEVTEYKTFVKHCKRKPPTKKKEQGDKKELEEMLAKAAIDRKNNALATISKGKGIDSLINDLESKYAKKEKAGKRMAEPSDEEFERIQKEIMNKKKKVGK